MSSVLHLFYFAEPVLMAAVLCVLLRSKDRRRFPALVAYFVLRLTSFLLFEGLLHIRSVVSMSEKTAYEMYFYAYWISYVVGAIAVFFVIQELFKAALEPLPGLMRLGSIAFRWVAGASLLAAVAAVIAPRTPGYRILMSACDQVMRCESIFVLCLLLFMVVAAGKLGLTYRSRIFGISFGFGVMATGNLVCSALLMNFDHNMMNTTISLVETAGSMLTLLIWAAYLLQKEPVRGAATLPATSPLVRWNEIALALGNSNRVTTMAQPAPANDFFLQDVEKVVDRILTKNSLSAAS
jgi:hypothetical protein